MTSLRDVLVAALKSLLRGKSLLKALLAFWSTSPVAPVTSVASQDASTTKPNADPAADFLAEAEHLLLGYIDAGGLKQFSRKLKRQFRERLRSNPECMLPSYNSQLPTGHESGHYLALDVGGSTLRVALVELRGRGAKRPKSRVIRMSIIKIDNHVRSLKGIKFFDWMAAMIHRTVSNDSERCHSLEHPHSHPHQAASEDMEEGRSPERPLLVGLAWSFPIEYVPMHRAMPRYTC